jgi:hypothetical protein
VKSISDILNSMVQPAEQNPLFSGSQSSSQGSNSSVGSFGDVLSRLTAQNQAAANTESNNTNSNSTTSNTPVTGSTSFSDTQISVTEVSVSENIQANNLNQATLNNVENAVASMAMALAKLVHLASNLQNFNQSQAQNLLVTASGGALSSSQAQQLVSQIADLKNQNNGQNALNLTAGQQNALLLQMMQSMIQNQQVTLTSSSDSQNTSTASGSSSSLQFNFAGNQNGQSGNAQVESLSIDIQTLNLQVANSSQTSASSANAVQTGNLTDATTQGLTQLLQQLNVAPSTTPVNIQVNSSAAATNSPELAQNFKNLVQILTQAGAGQAVLSTFLTQQKNDATGNNLNQAFNQLTQTQNETVLQSVAVTAVDTTGSANSAQISNQNNSLADQAQLLNDTLDTQNIQLAAQNAQPQGSVNGSGSNAVTTNLNIAAALTNTDSNTSATPSNQTGSAGQIVTNSIPSSTGASSNNQNTPVVAAVNSQQPTVPVIAAGNQTVPIQASGNPASSAPVVNGQTQTQLNGSQNPGVQLNNQAQPLPITAQTRPAASIQQVAPVQLNDQTQSVAIGAQTRPGTNVQQGAPVQLTDQQQINAQTRPATNVQLITAIQPNDQTQSAAPVVNVQAGQTAATNQNALAQATENQAQNATSAQNQTAPVLNTPVPAPVVSNVVQTVPVQPSASPAQPIAPVVTIQPQAPATITVGQSIQDQSAANTGNQTVSSQSEVVFTNGQLEALNGIVARFNSGIISASPTDNNNILNNVTPSIANPLALPTVNGTVPVQIVTPPAPVEQTANNVVLNNQSAQQVNNSTTANAQAQLIQPTSPASQQVTNTINLAAQNSFVQTASNAQVNNAAIANTETATGNTNNNAQNANNQPAPVISAAPTVQQVVTDNQATVSIVVPSSGNPSTAPVTSAATSPVITQPVTIPASMTAQNVLASTVAGEVAKAAVPAQVQTTVNNANNAPLVTSVSAVSAVQPVTAEGLTQVSTTSEAATNLNLSQNQTKDNLANTTDLQNLAAAVNAGTTATTGKATNAFQSTVNTVTNSNPNGSIDSAQIMNQIAQQVASQTSDAKMVSRLNFQLVPESLGRVTVQIALVDQSVSARITVSNPDVREVLQQHMVDLKAALSQAGLQIDQMQVQVQGGGANLLAQYYQYQQEGNSYRESAWGSNDAQDQGQTPDNSAVSAPVRSNTLLNLLV